jgi:Ca2+-binding RTX toxin-like protein
MAYKYKYGTNASEYLSATDSDDVVYAYAGSDTIDGWNGRDHLYGMDGDDWIYGGWGQDVLYGGNGSDHLYGQGDADRFMGAIEGQGDDFFYGDGGDDVVDYSGATAGMVISLKSGRAGTTGSAYGRDVLEGIEDVIGGDGSDIIHGNDPGFLGIGTWGENVLEGRGGHDWISGHGGNDWLYGGTGADTLYGGDGNDALYGEADADYLYGDAGDDKLYGGAGDDKMFGGTGKDFFDGGDGYDTVSFADLNYGVNLEHRETDFVSVEYLHGSNFDDNVDMMGWGYGSRLPYVFAGQGNDRVKGSANADLLYGEDGDDVIQGHWGADYISGGQGADTFVFSAMPTHVDSLPGIGSHDRIIDFQQGYDVIQLLTKNAGQLHFVGQAQYITERQIGFAYEGGNTVIKANFDTDNLPELEIALSGYVSLTANDFEYAAHPWGAY